MRNISFASHISSFLLHNRDYQLLKTEINIKFKKIGIGVAIFLLALFSLSVVGVYVFEDKIKAIAIERINANVHTEIKISAIELSFFKHFPNASIIFKDVDIVNPESYAEKGSLLKAKKVALTFNIFNLFTNNYRIKSVFVNSGELNILRNNDDEVNYIFWKKDDSHNENNMSFDVDKLVFEEMKFRYLDETVMFDGKALINTLRLKGKFNDEVFDLNAQIDFLVDNLKAEDYSFLKGKKLLADLSLNIDTKNERIEFRKSEIQLSGFQLISSGIWSYANSTSDLDILLSGKNMEIASILSLLPPEYEGEINDFESSGDFYFNASIKGKLNKKENPEVKADFGIKKGSISNKKKGLKIRKAYLTGYYSNGAKRRIGTSVIDVQTFDLEMQNGHAKGKIKLSNPEQLEIDLKADINIQLSEISAFLSTDKIQKTEGYCKGNFMIKGNFDDIQKIDKQGFKSIRTSGDLSFNNCSFLLSGSQVTYRNFNGRLTFDNNNIIVENFIGNVAGSSIEINGKLGNVFSYMASKNQTLFLDATLKANEINFDEFLKNENPSKTSIAYELSFPQNIKVNITADIDAFRFRKFSATNIEGKVSLSDGQFRTEKLHLKAMGGKLELSGTLTANNAGNFLIESKSVFTNVNIREMFTSFENFGQDVMMDANLNGKLNANLNFSAPMSKALDIDVDKVYALTELRITQGELINFEPLNAMSRFISLDELKLIKFSELKNQIEIKNKKIIIPRMDINSSALNITVSGTHSFDNIVDYHIKLYLNDLLAKKAKRNKRENNEFGVIEDDGLGKTKLFLTMKGSVDDPTFEYDRQGSKENRKQNLAEEKKELKQIFQKEFGKKDKGDEKKTNKKESIQQKIIVEWEDD
jgi:hypothetical protein